jgi:hypothetical protein
VRATSFANQILRLRLRMTTAQTHEDSPESALGHDNADGGGLWADVVLEIPAAGRYSCGRRYLLTSGCQGMSLNPLVISSIRQPLQPVKQ